MLQQPKTSGLTRDPRAASSRNLRKHTSGNPLERWLLGRFHRTLVAMAEEAIGPDVTPSILEVGCGEGFVLRVLRERWPQARLYGLDFSGSALAWAARQVAASLVLGDAGRLPVRTASAPFVIGAEVLEHLPDPQAALTEIARVAKPLSSARRAFVLFTVPHQPWFSVANLLRGKNWSNWGDDLEHLWRWTPSQFLALIGERFEVRSVRYSFPWLLALSEVRGPQGER